MYNQPIARKRCQLSLAITTALYCASPFQMAVANDAPGAEQDYEVILVKGGKRPKTLQEVAASVAVIGGEEMKQMKIEDLEDLSTNLPNVKISANAIQDTISIRGINSDLQAGGEQSVGIFVDGIFHGRGVQSRFSFLDVDTVEVLRGPQGALFGKNTIAGVIAINPAQPREDLEAKITLGYESESEQIETSGFVTGALNDSGSVKGRLAFKHYNTDKAYIENVNQEGDEDPNKNTAFRGILDWEVNEQLTLNIRAEDGNQEVNHIYWEMTKLAVNDPSLAPILGAYQAFGAEDNIDHKGSASQQNYPGLGLNGKDTPYFMDTNFSEYAFKANYALDAGNVTLIAAQSDYDYVRSVDADYGPLPILQFTDYEDYEQTSVELRFVSKDSDSFEYLVGAYYQDSDLDVVGVLDTATSPTSIAGGLFNQTMPLFEQMLSLPTGALANVYPQETITTRLHGLTQNTETYAIFGQVGIGLSDNLKLELSGRYSDEEKTASQEVEIYGGSGYGATSGNALLNPIEHAFWQVALFEATSHVNDLSRSESNFSPAANLAWSVDDDTNLYAAYSKGFKAGGFNALAMSADPAEAEYDEEEADSFEIGGKFTLLDGNAKLNVAVFSTDFKNLQTTVFTGGTTFVVRNAAEATTQGLEVDLTWTLSDEWTLYSTLGYIDFEFDSYVNAGCTANQMFANGLNGAQCAAAGVNDLSGKTNQDVPEYTTSLGLEYGTMFGEYEFISRLNVNYIDDYYAAPDLDEESKIDGYTLVDLSVKLISPDGDWDVAFVGRNLTDEEFYLYSNDTPLLGGSHQAGTQAPTTYTVQFSYHFQD
ncbi:TonB-dependent receptor [Thalassotalea atypica]|uniref:TonB-dependent receptor n=1 Tax=Thalassotalea atypica TaxID=2054316 RepID=UPI002573BC6B|nr:TonB-dependent receptor [Thalassotalea atypica]